MKISLQKLDWYKTLIIVLTIGALAVSYRLLDNAKTFDDAIWAWFTIFLMFGILYSRK